MGASVSDDIDRVRLSERGSPEQPRIPRAFDPKATRIGIERADDEEQKAREHLKRLIQQTAMPEYLAARLGYQVVERDTAGVKMSPAPGRQAGQADQVILSHTPEGGWSYKSDRNPQDRGNLQEFAQTRLRMSPAQLARDLDSFELEKKLKKLPALDIPTSSLSKIGIRTETLNSPAFRGTIRFDTVGNLAIAQRDRNGFCGIERLSAAALEAGRPASSFNGDRGLWVSNAAGPKDTKLVITATPLEALAYHQQNPSENVRYVCTGAAELTSAQKESLQMALAGASKHGKAPEVVIAFGRDALGEKLARDVSTICRDQVTKRHAPELGNNWTQSLQIKERDHIRAQGHRASPGLQR